VADDLFRPARLFALLQFLQPHLWITGSIDCANALVLSDWLAVLIGGEINSMLEAGRTFQSE